MSTYKNILDDARIPLRDASGSRLIDAKLLQLLNRVVIIAYRHAAKVFPDMFTETYSIPLTTTTGYGPYNLPADMESPVDIYDDRTQPKPLTKTSRSQALYTQSSMQPSEYWLEGHSPFRCYFSTAPDQDRTYTLYYIPIIARVTDSAMELPLPDLFFDMLVEMLVKFAGSVDEYITSDEDSFLTIITAAVDSILLELKPKIELELEGYGF